MAEQTIEAIEGYALVAERSAAILRQAARRIEARPWEVLGIWDDVIAQGFKLRDRLEVKV